MEVVFQLMVNAIIAASVYALIASGLSFIYATTRVFHLAHGVVIAIAGYVYWWAVQILEWNHVLGAALGCASAVVLGLAINEFVYEPLRRRKTKGLGYLVVTIALLMMGNAIIQIVFGAAPKSLGVQTTIFEVLGARFSLLQIFLVLFALALLFSLTLLVHKSRFGKAMRATADNEEVAEIMGINTRVIRRLTFAYGSFLGGVAGIFYTLEFNLDPNMSVTLAVKGFTAAVMGGAGSMAGAVLGSGLLGVFEQATSWYLGGGWKNAAAFVLLFVFLYARPRGFFGRKTFL